MLRLMNQKPIFILGMHKSGTSLLRSLFDGHPQLYTIPIESHYFQNMKYWVDNEYRFQRPEKLSKEEIIHSFCEWIHICNTSEDQFGDSIAKGLFDEEKFRDYFSSIRKEDDDKKRIEIYFEAIYYSVMGKKLSDKIRIVEKSVEHAEFAEELSRLFPEAKFIHIIRNPYANIVSLRKYKSIDFGFPIMRRIVRTFYNNYYYLYRNQRTIKNYYVLKYENLVSTPQKQIQQLCDFLDIKFEKILLIPSYQGKPWEGNSTTGKQFYGIDASNLERWKKEITPLEVEYINHLFLFVLRDYGYDFFYNKKSFWKPVKGENIKRYLSNRLYKFFLLEW